MNESIKLISLTITLLTINQFVFANQIDRTTLLNCKTCIKTGKERLGRKGNDEQRVNDCKVLIQKRGAKVRSADCTHRKTLTSGTFTK